MALGRRRLLTAATGAVILGGLAGCTGDGGDDGYSYRFDDGDRASLDPVVTETTHAEFYHGGEADETVLATHDYVASNAATMFVHRNEAATDGPSDGLVLTYDEPDSDGGQADLQFDESIDPDEDVVVQDDPEGETQNVDFYESEQFTHQWGSDFTDGVVIDTAALDEPTFEFRNVENVESIRVLSAAGDGEVDVATTGIDSTVQFQL